MNTEFRVDRRILMRLFLAGSKYELKYMTAGSKFRSIKLGRVIIYGLFAVVISVFVTVITRKSAILDYSSVSLHAQTKQQIAYNFLREIRAGKALSLDAIECEFGKPRSSEDLGGEMQMRTYVIESSKDLFVVWASSQTLEVSNATIVTSY